MSELANSRNGGTFRRHLLATASAVALTAYISLTSAAIAEDGERPTVWIELGGQLDRLSNAQQQFSPAFLPSFKQPGLSSALNVQNAPSNAFGEEGKITLAPDDSAWVFSASVRYGRAAASRQRQHLTKNAIIPLHISLSDTARYNKYFYPSRYARFANGKASLSETHLILDFQAGKDIGLGMFGSGSSSVISAGVRFVQFTSKSTVHLSGVPDLQYPTAAITSLSQFTNFKYNGGAHFHHYAADAVTQHSFHGVGPSLAWNASVPVVGNADSAELTFDWGANAAVLFGRQKASGHHQTAVRTYNLTGLYFNGTYGQAHAVHFGKSRAALYAPHHTVPGAFDRTRSVIVPNLGGFAGISLKWSNAKISLGYRADFFFGAMDGGIDERQSDNLGFNGPFATISVGIGG
jgi:hypothetical protein